LSIYFKKFTLTGQQIFQLLLRYQTFAVDYYSGMLGASIGEKL